LSEFLRKEQKIFIKNITNSNGSFCLKNICNIRSRYLAIALSKGGNPLSNPFNNEKFPDNKLSEISFFVDSIRWELYPWVKRDVSYSIDENFQIKKTDVVSPQVASGLCNILQTGNFQMI